jgi:guanylate kinase
MLKQPALPLDFNNTRSPGVDLNARLRGRVTVNDAGSSLRRRGLCLILSSPSGAGKTTLARLLLSSDETLRHSVSVTTRAPRPREKEGVDYYFVSRNQFEELRSNNNLLEWAEVFGNLYGTPAGPVKAALAEGQDIVFDVDWQGAASIAALLPDDTVRVFILPPSAVELSRRIHARASDSAHQIETRLKAAAVEMAHWTEYDYVLVNRDIDECLAALKAVLAAERLKRHRQVGLLDFVPALTSAAHSGAPASDAEDTGPNGENRRR